MRITSRRIGRGLFALAVAGVLGSGTAQAFGAPAAPREERVCNNTQCHANCKFHGATAGACNEWGECECIYFQ